MEMLLTTVSQLFFGEFMIMMNILVVFMGIEMISDFIRAVIKENMCPRFFWKKVLKKAFILFFVAIGYFLDVLFGTTMIQAGVLVFYIGYELLAIIEHADQAGIPVPPIILKVNEVLKRKNGNGKGK